MNEVLNTLLACKNNSRLKNPLQAKIQKLKNTRISMCIIACNLVYDNTPRFRGVGGAN